MSIFGECFTESQNEQELDEPESRVCHRSIWLPVKSALVLQKIILIEDVEHPAYAKFYGSDKIRGMILGRQNLKNVPSNGGPVPGETIGSVLLPNGNIRGCWGFNTVF